MVLEVATMDILSGENARFEQSLDQAQEFLKQSPGYISHVFHRCIEEPNRYVLLIHWETLEAHTVGFRESTLFVEWRKWIGPYFATAPVVQHFTAL